jgi:hypothetical protein
MFSSILGMTYIHSDSCSCCSFWGAAGSLPLLWTKGLGNQPEPLVIEIGPGIGVQRLVLISSLKPITGHKQHHPLHPHMLSRWMQIFHPYTE